MATAVPGIIINSIRGRIGSLVFYKRMGTHCVRTHVIPRNPDTEAQRIVRRGFGNAVRSWQALTTDEKYTFNKRARYMNMSGYNLYISEYMKTNISPAVKAFKSSLAQEQAASALSLNPIPSVSPPYTRANGLNKDLLITKPRPG